MDLEYPFSISGELPSRPKPADTPKATANTTTANARRSTSNSSRIGSIKIDVNYPTLKGLSRSKLHDFYVANEAELTKHISTAAGATKIQWGNDQCYLSWYEAAAPSSSSPSYSFQSTRNGPESHSLVKHASIPQSHAGTVVDVVLSRYRARPLGWVIGPGDDPDQGLLEVVLINRGLWLEDEQPVMVCDLEKTLPSPYMRSMRLMPRDYTGSFCGNRSGRQGVTTAVTTPVTATSTRGFHPRSDARLINFDILRSDVQPQQNSRMRPSQPEPPQQKQKPQQQQLNPALADYQLQLMLLEQQNKKRLMIQREADEYKSALQDQQNKREKAEEERRMQMMILEQQNKEKLLMQRKLEHMRLEVEESKKRAEHQLMLLQKELDFKPPKEKNRESDSSSTAVKQSQQPPMLLLQQQLNMRFRAPLSGEALDDYNEQLKFLEQVNKKRLMMARKEQDEQQQQSRREQGSQTDSTHHYETLDLLPEQEESDIDMVFVESADRDLVQTGVGVFHSIEKSEGEVEPYKNVDNNDNENDNIKPEPSSSPPQPPPPPPSAPERKSHVFHNGIMVMLLVSPAEVEDWVRTWAHEAAHGAGGGEADIAHWTGIYRCLLAALPSPSQFAMYVARDLSRGSNENEDNDNNIVGTGYLHLHASVASIHGITVLPKYRRRGIGNCLMRYGMKIAHEEGAKIAMLTATHSGANMFRRLGFRDFGRVKLYTWRPSTREVEAVKERELQADAEEEGWDWVSSSP